MDAGVGAKVESAAASAPKLLEWKFSQVFGERMPGEEVQEADVISSLEFDKKGDHLATGDHSGRIVLFERVDSKEKGIARKDVEKMGSSVSRNHPEFHYLMEFQSHEPEFDCLKSSEIEMKINKIRWCYSTNGALFLLSTNDRTIKFWKVQERKMKKVWDVNADPTNTTGTSSLASPQVYSNLTQYLANDLSCNSLSSSDVPGTLCTMRIPMVTSGKTNMFPSCRRVYANAHDYQVHSISYNSDGETFISADDLRINLWNLEISNQSYNIVDTKPTRMEDLTEVITAAEFHPTKCNLLAYSTSKGAIRLFDMRQSALGDSNSKLFAEKEEPGVRTFFTEIISSVSDVKFSMDGRHMLSRDYMTVKLWDINMDAGPVATYNVHDHLKPKLSDLYENDSIFDKFECCPSGDGSRFATGSYSNMFRVFGCAKGSTESTTLEASKQPMRRQILNPLEPWSTSSSGMTRVATHGTDTSGNSFDLTPKLLHLAWHPSENCIACASANSLYMYYA